MLVAFVLLFTPLSTFNAKALDVAQQAVVIASRSNLYVNPDFASEKVTTFDEFGQTVIISVFHNNTVTVLEEVGDFAKIETSNNHQGYIYKYYLTQNSTQQVYPFFNATIRNDTTIFDIEQKETAFTAKQNQRAYIYQGFNEKEDYTAVQIVLEDGSLYNGYVLTSNIKPDGVNSSLIVAITIIVATTTIVLSIVFIRKKSKKKKDKG